MPGAVPRYYSIQNHSTNTDTNISIVSSPSKFITVNCRDFTIIFNIKLIVYTLFTHYHSLGTHSAIEKCVSVCTSQKQACDWLVSTAWPITGLLLAGTHTYAFFDRAVDTMPIAKWALNHGNKWLWNFVNGSFAALEIILERSSLLSGEWRRNQIASSQRELRVQQLSSSSLTGHKLLQWF